MARRIINLDNEFRRVREQINRLFDSFFARDFDTPLLESSDSKNLSLIDSDNYLRTPYVDLYEKDNNLIAEIELPGVNKEDIKLSVEDGYLNISAEKKYEKEDKDKKYRKYERAYSFFQRSLKLPDEVDESKVKAKYEDGILKVVIPKSKERTKGKYVDIE